MKKILDFLRSKKYVYYLAGAVVLVLAGVFLFQNKQNGNGTIVVARGNFLNQVSVSGKVETTKEADLGFAASGRIAKIYTQNNEKVRAGQILAQLDVADLLADLKIKEINSKTSDVELEDARENLEKITAEENTKVESAYRELLTEDLELVASADDYTVGLPTISGIYDGPEGTYKIIITIHKGSITSSDLDLFTFKLENTKRIINKEGATPLGTRGLYITFPDSLDLYNNTIWYLKIPNKASSSYLANFNAYNEAKKAQDLAIRNAESDYQKLLTEKNDGASSVAQAEIDKIRAEIQKNTIYAPFDGVVTNIEKEIGEVASQNETVVTMMSAGIFQIESYVPEVNIALIKAGDEAKVTLDAYGENVLFGAKVISIDPAETIRDGVSTYKVRLQFLENDNRIKSGMTANVSIIIFNKPDVIVVPGGVVFEKDGKNFVQVKTLKDTLEREVILGDVSSLGQVEIISGLEEGEMVLLNPNTK